MSSAFVENLVTFAQALRTVGVRCTPAQTADVARALAWVGVEDRETVFRTARSLFVTRREDLVLFETVFNRFWRVPEPTGGAAGRATRLRRRSPAAEQFTVATYAAFRAGRETEERDVLDRSGTAGDEEALKRRRFAQMTEEELAAARRMIARLRWEAALRRTRRRAPDSRGPEIDLRRVLREASRLGAVPARVPRKSRKEKRRPLVLLADVSGSMERYSKLLLHFFHTLLRELPDAETFVFGTRLSRITPALRLRNVDRALDEAATQVVDWAGGTRIGACLGDFNRRWGRRVLRRGALVVLVSDGCERGDPSVLAREMRWLHARCARLIWVNPHAGHERYAPSVAGMRAALPFVDDFLPLGDLGSFAELAEALTRLRRPRRGRPARRLGSGARHAVASRVPDRGPVAIGRSAHEG